MEKVLNIDGNVFWEWLDLALRTSESYFFMAEASFLTLKRPGGIIVTMGTAGGIIYNI